jgi:hypothetical protein
MKGGVTINAGMIFSVCAGILIGLRLYVWMKAERPKQKEEKRKQEEEAILKRQIESYRKYQEGLRKNELLKQQLDDLLEKEKYKVKNEKPLPTNPFSESLKMLQEQERTKQFIREIWYGSSSRKPDTAKELEDILKDPDTLVMSDGIDPLHQFVKIKNRGRTYFYYSDGSGCEEEKREPQYYYAGEYDPKLTYRKGDVVTRGDEQWIYKGDNLFELLGGVLTPNEIRKVVLNDCKGEGTA